MKTCKKCGVDKPLTEFYHHPDTADGYLHICKDCKRQYQREISQTEHYKQREAIRNKTEKRRLHLRKNAEKWIAENPDKRKAENKLHRAIRTGKIIKSTICQECGKSGIELHGHHEDYSKPLQVIWLCPACHGKRNPHYLIA